MSIWLELIYYIGMGFLIAFPLLLLSIVLHEVLHYIVCRYYGYRCRMCLDLRNPRVDILDRDVDKGHLVRITIAPIVLPITYFVLAIVFIHNDLLWIVFMGLFFATVFAMDGDIRDIRELLGFKEEDDIIGWIFLDGVITGSGVFLILYTLDTHGLYSIEMLVSLIVFCGGIYFYIKDIHEFNRKYIVIEPLKLGGDNQ